MPTRTHTAAHWPFTHTGGRLRPRLWGRGCARAPAHQAPTQAPSGGPTGPGHPRAPAGPPELRSLPGQSPVWGMQGPHRFPRGTYLGNSCPSPEAASSPECFPGGRRAAGGPSWDSQGLGGLRPVPFREQGGAPTRGRSRREGAPLFTTALGRGRPPLHGPGGQACQMALLSPGRPVLGGQRGKPLRF